MRATLAMVCIAILCELIAMLCLYLRMRYVSMGAIRANVELLLGGALIHQLSGSLKVHR